MWEHKHIGIGKLNGVAVAQNRTEQSLLSLPYCATLGPFLYGFLGDYARYQTKFPI